MFHLKAEKRPFPHWRILYEKYNIVLSLIERITNENAISSMKKMIFHLKACKDILVLNKIKVGDIALYSETDKYITSLTGYISALEEDTISYNKFVKSLLDIKKKVIRILNLIQPNIPTAGIKKTLKRIDPNELSKVLEQTIDQQNKTVELQKYSNDLPDVAHIVNLTEYGEFEKNKIVNVLNIAKMSAKTNVRFVNAPVSLYIQPNSSKFSLEQNNIPYKYVASTVILPGCFFAVAYCEPGDEINVAEILNLAKKDYKREFVPAFNEIIARTNKVRKPYLVIRGLKNIKFLWLLEREKITAIFDLKIIDFGFPWN